MAKQQKVNKFIRDLNYTGDIKKTQNTFNEDVAINRAEVTRRDTDPVEDPHIGLYHIDYAVKSFIEQRVKPTVEQDGETVTVPVMYANPEKWASVQSKGFMRDDKGKIIAPVIVFNRTGMNRRNELMFNKVLDEDSNRMIYKRKYTKFNRYDAFSQLVGSVPTEEYYSLEIPDYVDINYSMVIWTDYVTQVNHLSEQIIYWSGQAWGETFKFIVKADNFTFETTNNTGEDRLVRANVDFSIKAHLVHKEVGKEATLKKYFSKSKLVFNNEAVVDINDLPINSYGTGSRIS